MMGIAEDILSKTFTEEQKNYTKTFVKREKFSTTKHLKFIKTNTKKYKTKTALIGAVFLIYFKIF